MVSCWYLLLVFVSESMEQFITGLFVIGTELKKTTQNTNKKTSIVHALCAVCTVHTQASAINIGTLENRPFMSQVTSFFSILNSSNLIQIKRKLCK